MVETVHEISFLKTIKLPVLDQLTRINLNELALLIIPPHLLLGKPDLLHPVVAQYARNLVLQDLVVVAGFPLGGAFWLGFQHWLVFVHLFGLIIKMGLNEFS